MNVSSDHLRLLRLGGLVTWLMVGLPVLLAEPIVPRSFMIWLVAYIVLGVAFAANVRGHAVAMPHRLLLLAAQSAAVIVMVRLLCNGWEGTLLVLIAMQLGLIVDRRPGLYWIALQSTLMFWGIATHWSPRSAILLTPPYVGFQLFAFFTFQILAAESRAREELSRANAELRALQQMFAETSRMAERVRISQELHDALGHHLTALSLNLEVAAHQTEDPARENVRKAQSLARLLLADVREIVHALKKSEGVEVDSALRALVSGVPRPIIHLKLPEGLTVSDPERAHVLIRCTQEIVTNAIRHSGADNLWINIFAGENGVEVHARDDGKGSAAVEAGDGLSGMQSRLASIGGSLRVDTAPGVGFAVIALLPYRGAVA